MHHHSIVTSLADNIFLFKCFIFINIIFLFNFTQSLVSQWSYLMFTLLKWKIQVYLCGLFSWSYSPRWIALLFSLMVWRFFFIVLLDVGCFWSCIYLFIYLVLYFFHVLVFFLLLLSALKFKTAFNLTRFFASFFSWNMFVLFFVSLTSGVSLLLFNSFESYVSFIYQFWVS